MEDEKTLIDRAKNGDEQAFSLIYRRYFDDIYSYVYWSTGSVEVAEDLTEEVFFRVLKYIDKYDGKKAAFKSWIFRIARNLIIDHFRSRSRHFHEALNEGLGEEDGRLEEIEEQVEEEEIVRLLREGLGMLTGEQRQVILMKYFLGMNNQEVGEIIGKRKGAVNSLQNRALNRLGAFLRERGYGIANREER